MFAEMGFCDLNSQGVSWESDGRQSNAYRSLEIYGWKAPPNGTHESFWLLHWTSTLCIRSAEMVPFRFLWTFSSTKYCDISVTKYWFFYLLHILEGESRGFTQNLGEKEQEGPSQQTLNLVDLTSRCLSRNHVSVSSLGSRREHRKQSLMKR